jgi:hypothetical protein
MWQRLYCPSCGYGLIAGDRFCGNCGVKLAKAESDFNSTSTPCADEATQEIMRRVNAYRKLRSASRAGNNSAMQKGNAANVDTGIPAATPIRNEITRLLASLLSN